MTDVHRPSPDPTADTSVHPVADPATVTETPATPIATTTLDAPGEAVPAVATAPVSKRSGRARWIAAGLVVALVVGVSAIATLSLTGSSPNATVLGYVPADSIAYGEVRMDLPGDQGRKIGEFLSKFPGFADQAALETKLDEVLDRLVSEGSGGSQTFSGDIKPWFDGELAFAMGPLPTGASLQDTSAAPDFRGLLLISVKDAAAAQTWFNDAMGESGVSGQTQDYAGTQLTVFGEAGMDAAFGIIGGEVAVAGDLTSVKAAVDSRGASALAEVESFKAALAANEGDHVGFMYVDFESLMAAALEMNESMGMGGMMSEELLELVPEWAAFRLRVEGDALVMDGATPHVAEMPGTDENAANGVAAYAPSSTIMLAAGNDTGQTLLETVELYEQDPNMAEGLAQVQQALGVIGGLEAAVGWMGDTGLVLSRAGDSVEGGLVSIPTDGEDAEQLLTTIRSFVALGGGQAGISVREEAYAGTTITIIDLGSAEDLLGLAGAMGGVPLEPGMTGVLPQGSIEISYAATDGVVVLGSGPDFVKAVLDAGSGESLADTARYRDLVARVGAEHTGVQFLDITAIRGLAEGFLDMATAEERAEYEESIKPFLEPFDALVAATVVGAEIDAQHTLITVR